MGEGLTSDSETKSRAFATKHANGQTNGQVNGFSHAKERAFRACPAYKPRKLRIVTIGAGYSGLTLAHKFQHQHAELQNFIEHTIYEARSELGGTWLVNTYPGVVCDVPSHIYAFPFDPNPDWSHFFSTGAEIWNYMKKTAQKWNLERDVKYNHRVVGAYWQEARGQWKVLVEHDSHVSETFADVLISAQGFLNEWKWPEIQGLHSFQGKKVHSADWDHAFDYSNKRIAIIGNGSSGIQILPQMAKIPGTHVTSFQRAPTYVVSTMNAASLLGNDDPAYNPKYSARDKQCFLNEPGHHHKYRKTIIHRINDSFKMFVKGSELNDRIFNLAHEQMAEKLQNDSELCKKLIPTWEIGCRRITPGEGYLESFLRSNVDLTQSPIAQVEQNGIRTMDGQFYEVDVVVCATGFDVSYRPKYPIIGKKSVDLRDKWAQDPRSYLSLAASDMPNLFMFTGPNALIGHGSLMESLGWSAEWMIEWIKKIASENIKCVTPKEEAIEDFINYSDEIHRTLTWTGACRSWYKNNTVDGRVTATFGGSALLFKRLIKDVRPEDFDVEYQHGNRFTFMGNGFTEYELDPKNDLAWYVER